MNNHYYCPICGFELEYKESWKTIVKYKHRFK